MSLRLMPNLHVYRPADAVETAECWALALERRDGPSLLALTRQNLPQLRTGRTESLSARGAYRLRAAAAARRVVLIATGSEVEVAVAVAEALEGRGSAPTSSRCPAGSCSTPRTRPIGATCFRTASSRCRSRPGRRSAGSAMSGRSGLAIGLDRFGASAPAEDLFKRFGFTAEAIVPRIVAALKSQGDQ